MPEHTQLRLLRLAGIDPDQLTRTLRAAASEGCPGLRLLEKDGEYAVCIQAKAESALSAAAICDSWEKRLRSGLGDAVFTVGEAGLPEAVVASCAAGQKLLVAADAATGALLEERLAKAEDARAVYDFGTQSYAHPKKADRLAKPGRLAKKYPGQPLQAGVDRALAALRISGADYALTLCPAGGDQPAAALLCTPKQVWAMPLAEGPRQQPAAATALLDMVRRRAAGLPIGAFGKVFAVGHPAPPLAAPPVPASAPAAGASGTASPAAPASAPASSIGPAASGVPVNAPAPGTAAQGAASAPARAAQVESMAAGIAAGIASQNTAFLGEAPAAPAPVSGQVDLDLTGPGPAAGTSPAAPGATAPAAPDAPENAPLSSQERMANAAHSLFTEEDDPADATPTAPGAGRILLCAILVAVVAALAALAVWLGQNGTALLGSRLPAYRSYGTADFDAAAQSYLREAQEMDAEAAAYLALPGQPGTLVYQQTAGARGAYPGAVLAAEAPEAANAAEPQNGLACFAGEPLLGQAHSNTILYCPPEAIAQLGALDEEAVLAENCGFTLYDGDDAYRYKVAAVFYWDPAETGESAFPLESLRELSNYRDYLTFVLGIKARSLYDMPVDIDETDTFATLIADAKAFSGAKLAVVGRRQRQDETAILSPRGIVSALQPLYTAAQYAASGLEAPAIGPLTQYWLNWYLTGARTGGDLQESAGMPEDDPTLDEVKQSGQQTGPDTDPDADPDATPDPSADPNGDPDATPDPSASPDPSATPEPTPGPTPSADPQPTAPPAEATPAPTPAPTPTPPPAGKTINVTMNGTAQTMDLVTCLAMIAQNELGYGQPAEAYKAQAVASHSWILNQGGYPAVSGLSPSQAVLDAVQQVADQVVTYNGSVAFTPYTASVAGGTCSSQDVWGGYKPYLVEVDSPYDAQYASNWQNVREYTADEVAARALEREGVDLRAYSTNPADWLGDLVKTTYGYVRTLRLGNKTISGDRLRLGVLNNVNGASGKSLRSTAFEFSYDAGRGVFVFTTYGYGHGCGLSQWGAVGYARNGWGYADILAHYFPGTSLSTV